MASAILFFGRSFYQQSLCSCPRGGGTAEARWRRNSFALLSFSGFPLAFATLSGIGTVGLLLLVLLMIESFIRIRKNKTIPTTAV